MNELERVLDLASQKARFHKLIDELTERDSWMLLVAARSEDDTSSQVHCHTNAHRFEALGLLACASRDLEEAQ